MLSFLLTFYAFNNVNQIMIFSSFLKFLSQLISILCFFFGTKLLKFLMHEDIKWPNVPEKFCAVHNVRFLSMFDNFWSSYMKVLTLNTYMRLEKSKISLHYKDTRKIEKVSIYRLTRYTLNHFSSKWFQSKIHSSVCNDSLFQLLFIHQSLSK